MFTSQNPDIREECIESTRDPLSTDVGFRWWINIAVQSEPKLFYCMNPAEHSAVWKPAFFGGAKTAVRDPLVTDLGYYLWKNSADGTVWINFDLASPTWLQVALVE